MKAEVAFECQCVTEACTTDRASVWPLSCMDPLMDLEVVLTVEVSSAQATMIRAPAEGKRMTPRTLIMVIVELWEVGLLA